MGRMKSTLSKRELIDALDHLPDDAPVFVSDYVGIKAIGSVARAKISRDGWFTVRGHSSAVVIMAEDDESTIARETSITAL